MYKFSRAAAMIICGVSLCGSQLVAQNRAKIQDINSTTSKVELSPISITANKSLTEIAKYAGQISVLNPSDLARTPSVIEAMNEMSGIDTGNDYGRQVGQSFQVRGFGYQSENRVIIEQDGIKRSASLYSNQISTFRVDNDLLKRVEVVKGASSVLHGSGAIGGIISMQTKSVDDFIVGEKDYGLMVAKRLESNNMNSQRAALAFKPASNLGILIYGKHAKFGDNKLADGGNGITKKTQNDERINTFFGKIEWDILDGHRLEMSAFDYHENVVTGWQSLWWPTPGTAPTIGRIKQRDYSVTYSYAPINNNLINFSAQYFNTKGTSHRIRSGVVGRTNISNDYTNKDKRWGLNLKNESLFDTGSLAHRLVVGAEYENRKEYAEFKTATGFLEFNSHPNFYKDYGLYAQDIISVGDFEFTLGGRYDYFKRGVAKDNRQSYSSSRFSPKFSVAYEVLDGLNLLAGYAETFRGPTPHETSSMGPINPVYWYLPNDSLKPETAKEFEFGFSIDRQNLLGDDRLFLKATYYIGKIKDMIAIQAVPQKGTPPFDPNAPSRRYGQYDNIDEAKRSGYELEARYKVLNFGFNLAYDHIKIYNKSTGKRISAYADKLTLGTSYSYSPWGLSSAVSMTHYFTPKRDVKSYVQSGTTYEYIDRSFTIFNFRGSWTPKFNNKIFGEGFKVGFGINNIFDKKYINASRTKDTTLVGKGRNFYIDFEKIF